MHAITCTCDRCDKARACELELIQAGQTLVYSIRSPTGETYTVVNNTNNVFTCNCECGQHKKNSTCAHVQRARWEKKVKRENATS